MAEKKTSSEVVLSTMRKRLDTAITAYSSSRQSELDDLKFLAGTPDNQWQWPTDVISSRTTAIGTAIAARPCLTINKLPQHVKQVTNDQRQNRPSGKVIPVDNTADVEVAEILDGMIRHIESISDADVAYDTACDNQVTFGEGYWRILTEYCQDDSFDQDIKIARIRNSFSVYMDPMIQDPCGSDAEWCVLSLDMPKEQYEREYPDAAPISTLQAQGVGDECFGQWVSDKTIRIAEYFHAEYTKTTLCLYPGNVALFKDSPDAKAYAAAGMVPIREREVQRRKIMWCKSNGYEILEEREWAGSSIPVIRVVGNEFEVEGELHVSGLVRNAKDAQRMYNYWVSQEAEMLALAPKAPFIGYAGQFEGFEDKWKTANTQPWPYLEVNPDVTDAQGGVLPLPQRALPPMAQNGLIAAKMGAADDIKSTTGQYDPALGEASNERTGRAIIARQQQSSTGTYHYVDNNARAVRYSTRQIIELIPKIYDTERIARIVGMDGEVSSVKINPSQPEAVKKITDQAGNVIEKIYNPGVGRYDVAVTTGPSYMTKRQEALEGMVQLLQGNPELWAVAGDLFVKHMDWPGAQELSKRLAKMVDPKLLADTDDSPELTAAKQQIEGMGEQMEQMHQMLQNVQQSMEMQELRIKEYDAETKRLNVVSESMTPEDMRALVVQTLRDIMEAGDQAAMQQQGMPMEQPMEQGMPMEQPYDDMSAGGIPVGDEMPPEGFEAPIGAG
jgi:hypothetical protein